MSDSPKRVLTDDNECFSTNSTSLSRNDTSPELSAQLRSIGSRIRKSVTEGYITPPTTRAFNKAQSTTTIFSSAKDINRDVFGSPSKVAPIGPKPADPMKKRSRSVDRDNNTLPDEASDSMAVDVQPPQNDPDCQHSRNKIERVIKPLRKHRGMMETRSLPAGAFQFSHQPRRTDTAMLPTEEAEEDWSTQPSHNSTQSPFEPVLFD